MTSRKVTAAKTVAPKTVGAKADAAPTTSLGITAINASLEVGYTVGKSVNIGAECAVGAWQGAEVGYKATSGQYASAREAKLAELRARLV